MANTPSDCCDVITGGRIVIRTSDGKTFEGYGDCEIEPRNINRKADATSSGRMSVQIEPKLFICKIPFANLCDADPLDLFDQSCKVNVTVLEVDRGFSHMFTAASIIGTPRLNAMQGKIENMEIHTDKYQRITS